MSRPSRSNQTAVDATHDRARSPVWLFVIGLFLAARYLQPTEGAVFGETLWQAQLWLVVAAAWCWRTLRTPNEPLCLSPVDLLLWGLVVGHALAAIPVFLDGGDRRAAANLIWEWAGLAAMWFVVRQHFQAATIGRPVVVFVAAMAALASLGVWQYHVSTPRLAERYASLRQEEADYVDRVESGAANAADRRRLAQVREELLAFSVPEDTGARQRWEDRIQHSTEPLGTFALANTFGGLLAAVLPWLVLSGFATWRRGRQGWPFVVGAIAAAGVVLYCLLLTKSRTAWAGLAFGLFVAVGLSFARRRKVRPHVAGIIAAAAVLLLMSAVVFLAGGLDRQVVSEAPKSLQYRLDYWNATLQILAERPWLGTGPGNFRTHYLEHRLPGASEEIAAPHNLLLDAWTAGGLLSLVLLLALLGRTLWLLSRPAETDSAGDEIANDRSHATAAAISTNDRWTGLETGAVAAFPVIVVIGWLAGNGFDLRLLAIAPIAAIALACLAASSSLSFRWIAAAAGTVTLFVHLLGADGFEFPAVMQSLLLLLAVVDRPWHRMPADNRRWWPAAAFGMLAVGCLLTGTVPVLNGTALTNAGLNLVRNGNPSAERVLSDAAAADPWALEPKVVLAELATARALASEARTDQTAAVRRWDDVLRADPRHLRSREQLATLAVSGDAPDPARAASLLTEAVALSPTDVQLRVRLATIFADLGRSDDAAEQATAGLRLDDLNRAAGHVDVVLDAETRTALERQAERATKQ